MEKIEADGWRFSDIQALKSHLVGILDGVNQELLENIQVYLLQQLKTAWKKDEGVLKSTRNL